MRKIWFVLFLVALIAPSINKFNASRADSGTTTESAVSSWRSTIIGLPDYDVRREVADIQTLSKSGPVTDAAVVQARKEAIEDFRASLSTQSRDGLRYEINDAGVPNALFNLSAPLSAPIGGSGDQIARDFLRKHTALFGLTSRDVRRLALETEDNDQGINFLHYRQTIGCVRVFQGQVQVVVGAAGEFLSVMEGLIFRTRALMRRRLCRSRKALLRHSRIQAARPPMDSCRSGRASEIPEPTQPRL